MTKNEQMLREFIRAGVSIDEKIAVVGNRAILSDGGALIRYRLGNERIVLTDLSHCIGGGFRNIQIEATAMQIIVRAYDRLREDLISKAFREAIDFDRLDRLLDWHGAPRFSGLVPTPASERHMRARMGIYANRYVVFDDLGYSCFASMDEAVLDKMRRTNPGVGLFDAGPQETGTFVVT
jgi:hypothetical protein